MINQNRLFRLMEEWELTTEENIELVGFSARDEREEGIQYIMGIRDCDRKAAVELYDEYEIAFAPTPQQKARMEAEIAKAKLNQMNKPKCPICSSTNLSKISGMTKAAKIGMFGIFGAGDIGKTWKCNNCGSKF